MKLTMVGTGYVGLVTGTCLANTGNDVMCLDVDQRKIDVLLGGGCPIYEPGLTEMMESNIKADRLHFTTDAVAAYTDADMVFICVGTPSDEQGQANLQYVFSAADDIAQAILNRDPQKNPLVVVVKSTVPVGTTHAVKERIGATVGDKPFHVADNPEFLKEGAAINDFNKPDRVVVGVEDEFAANKMRELYDPFVRQGHPIYIMDVRSAEMVKYASNNFLATKISYINEMSRLCEVFGADIDNVRQGMCADKRIGNQFLYPGLGYGGSCFPKDTLACMSMGTQTGTPMQLSTAVHEVNQRQRVFFFEKIVEYFGSKQDLAGMTIAFWGIAFKPNTDDIREAPAITLMQLAADAGATIRAHDPVAAANAKAELGDTITLVDDLYETLAQCDALVISTDWDEFKSPDFSRVKDSLRAPVIFDGRNLYKPSQMQRLGFTYYSIGRKAITPEAITA
jgi:UDPglucose 6-dehydrogenase